MHKRKDFRKYEKERKHVAKEGYVFQLTLFCKACIVSDEAPLRPYFVISIKDSIDVIYKIYKKSVGRYS